MVVSEVFADKHFYPFLRRLADGEDLPIAGSGLGREGHRRRPLAPVGEELPHRPALDLQASGPRRVARPQPLRRHRATEDHRQLPGETATDHPGDTAATRTIRSDENSRHGDGRDRSGKSTDRGALFGPECSASIATPVAVGRMRYHLISKEVVEVADVLIRDVPDAVLAEVDAHAARLGLSRVEYIRRRLAADASASSAHVTAQDLRKFADTFADLADREVMDEAWR